MSPFVLSVLKYSLLVLLYLFIYRAVKAVAIDLRGQRRPKRVEAKPARAPRTLKGGKVPTSVAVRSADGKKLGSYRLASSLEIGRAETCGIRLDDTYVSQVHAKLYGRNGTWFVEDMGSTNGTFVNDGRVQSPVEVHAGDRIRVGKTVLELRR